MTDHHKDTSQRQKDDTELKTGQFQPFPERGTIWLNSHFRIEAKGRHTTYGMLSVSQLLEGFRALVVSLAGLHYLQTEPTVSQTLP
jgi:hypothetical protein